MAGSSGEQPPLPTCPPADGGSTPARCCTCCNISTALYSSAARHRYMVCFPGATTGSIPWWYKCLCRAGDARCICPSTSPPGNLAPPKAPQFVLFTVGAAPALGMAVYPRPCCRAGQLALLPTGHACLPACPPHGDALRHHLVMPFAFRTWHHPTLAPHSPKTPTPPSVLLCCPREPGQPLAMPMPLCIAPWIAA